MFHCWRKLGVLCPKHKPLTLTPVRRRLEIWGPGNLEICEFGDLEIWKFGDLRTWKSGNLGSKKISKYKSILRKMSARSGSVGKNPPDPIWGHPRPFFPWTRKSKKCQTIVYFARWANGPYSPDVGPCCHPPEVGK